MNDRKDVEKVQHALDATFSNLKDNPWLAQKVLTNAKQDRSVGKKLSVSLTIIIVIVLMATVALAAGIFTYFFHLGREDIGTLGECVSTGDTLYLMTSKGFSTWAPGEDLPQTVVSRSEFEANGISLLASVFLDDTGVGLLDQAAKTVWHYEDHQFSKSYDYQGTELGNVDLCFAGLVYQDERAYLRALPLNDATDSDGTLLCADLQTGRCEKTDISNVLEICGYQPGQILALVRDADTWEDSVFVIDTRSNSVQKVLCSMPAQGIQGLAFDSERGLYAQINGVLSHWDHGTWTGLNGYASNYLSKHYAVVGEGYVCVSLDDLQYIPFDKVEDLTSVTMQGFMDIYNHDAEFQLENSGIAIVRNENPTITIQEVSQAIASGDTTDLFHVWLDGDLLAMMANGSIAPLTGSSVLVSDVNAMTSVIRDRLFLNGSLFAVPSVAAMSVLESNAELPSTWTAFLNQADASNASPLQIYWNSGKVAWTKEDYARQILSQWITDTVSMEDAGSFKDESLVSVLKALQSLTLPVDNAAASSTQVATLQAVDLHGEIVNAPENGSQRDYIEIEPEKAISWVLLPSVSGSDQSIVQTRLAVYILNPNALHPEEAMDYLEYMASHREAGEEGLLKPNQAEATLAAGAQAWIDELTTQMGEGTDTASNSAQAQTRVDEIRSDPLMWTITERKLEAYKTRIVLHMDLMLQPLLSASSRAEGGTFSLMLQAVMDYVNGGSLDHCLDRLECLLKEQAE